MKPSRTKPRRSRWLSRSAAVVLAMAAVVGCSQSVVYNRNFVPGYSPSSIVGQPEPLLVVTYGTPGTGQSPESVTAATVRGLEERGPRWARLKYSGDPADSPNQYYVLRFAYGAARAFDRADVCKPDLQVSDIGNDGTSARTVVALCRLGRWVAIAEGSPGLEADIESAEFIAFVGLIGRRVLPRSNPVLDNECVLRACRD